VTDTNPSVPFLPLLSIYGDYEIAAVFTEVAFVESWLEVERALAVAQSELGLIPRSAAEAISHAAVVDRVDIARIRAQTEAVGYPIVSLLQEVSTGADPRVSSYLHWGATTQDIMDTGLVLLMRRAWRRIEELVLELGETLAEFAQAHRDTLMAGRTHGQLAVPTTLGAKAAVWLDETRRHVERLRTARHRSEVIQLFGAAGTAAALGPRSREVRARTAAILDLDLVNVPWHTARDRLAEVGFVLAAIAATCGKIAREVIELSRNEVGEVLEQGPDQHGASSTMPQKQNPSRCEAVVGMSASARAQVSTLLGAILGTHERSAGEWQMEWDTIPVLFTLTGGCLDHTRRVIATARVVPQRMLANLDSDGGLVMAEAVMIALAPEYGRAKAYDLVTAASRRARANQQSLAQALACDPGVRAIDASSSLFDPATYIGEAASIVATAVELWSATDGVAPRRAT
jgi:3-carboxy-cis,cis-muconate cycloisomerase